MNHPLTVAAVLAVALPSTTLDAEGDNYGADVEFLRRHVDLIELEDQSGRARVALVAAYQGRVMTSSATGPNGFSFGWINRELIASGRPAPHINVFGGEDRFWLGPEGGPFSLFFAPAAPAQTFEHWQTPVFIDTKPWSVARRTRTEVEFTGSDRLLNRAGHTLAVSVRRIIRLIEPDAAREHLGLPLPAEIDWVGFESENQLTNAGERAWSRATGMPSIWILGMFKPGTRSTIVIPLRRPSQPSDLPMVRSDYFGDVPSDRLRRNGEVVFFRGDGEARGKIGIPPPYARPILGSWDAARSVLTVVQYNLPDDASARPYVDSRWIDMPAPYAGDVVNAYNDGPPAPGAKPLGPFYELETSSPAAELPAGGSLIHFHRTFHFTGPRPALDTLASRLLGADLRAIEQSLD